MSHETHPPVAHTGTRRPYWVAVLTVFAWNAVVVTALAVWAILSRRGTPQSPPPDGMESLALAVVVVILGAALAVGSGLGAWLAVTSVSRKLRSAARRSEQATITARGAILWGTISAPLGWVLGAAAVMVALTALNTVSAMTS